MILKILSSIVYDDIDFYCIDVLYGFLYYYKFYLQFFVLIKTAVNIYIYSSLHEDKVQQKNLNIKNMNIIQTLDIGCPVAFQKDGYCVNTHSLDEGRPHHTLATIH